MNANVEMANAFRQRYAIVVRGAYVVFELLEAGTLPAGDRITGNLEAFGLQVWSSEHLGRIHVRVEDFHRSRSSAEQWVEGLEAR